MLTGALVEELAGLRTMWRAPECAIMQGLTHKLVEASRAAPAKADRW